MAPRPSRKPAVAPRAKSARAETHDPIAAFLAAVPTVPATELSAYLNYAEPCIYKPQTSNLANLRMEADDIQILRYLFRNSAPKRHLEFGTWEGRTTRACLEESGASVWTINLREGETRLDGQWAYTRSYAVEKDDGPPGRYKAMGRNARDAERENRTYQTDAFNFIGHLVHEASLGHRVCQILCDSREWDISAYPPGFFDSVLLDGGHDAQTVISDTRKALALVRDGGLLLWHDFCPDPKIYSQPNSSCSGVVAGLASIWEEIGPQLSRCFWIRTTWLLVGIKAARESAAETPVVTADEKKLPVKRAVLESTAAELRSEIRQFSQVRDEYQRAQTQILDLQSHIAVLEKRLASVLRAEEQHDLLQERLSQLDKLSATLTSERDRLQHQLAAAGEERSSLQLQTHKAEGERDLLRDRIQAVEGQCQGLFAERDALRRQILQIEVDNSTLSKQVSVLSDIEQRHAAAETLAARLAAERDATSRELDAAKTLVRDVMSSKEDEVRKMTAEVAGLSEQLVEIDRLRTNVVDLQAAVVTKGGEVQVLTAELAGLTSTLEQSNRAYSLAENKISSLETSLQNEADRSEELLSAYSSLSTSAEAGKRQVRELMSARDNLVSKNGELDREVSSLRAAQAALADALDRERHHSGEVRADRDSIAAELLASIGAAERQIGMVTAERDSLTTRHAEAAAAFKRETERHALVAAALTKETERHAAVATALRQEEERRRLTASERDTLDAALKTTESERAALEAERSKLAERYQNLSGEAAALSMDVEGYRAAVEAYEHSTSWRITAPIRRVVKLARKITQGSKED